MVVARIISAETIDCAMNVFNEKIEKAVAVPGSFGDRDRGGQISEN